MLNENHITEILADYFKSNDYRILTKLTTTQKGIDLIVKDKQGVSIYVEIKGETSATVTSKRYGKPFNRNQITNHVGRALLATFKAINTHTLESDKFAIAFPDTNGHELVLMNIKSVLDKLNITIYLVSNAGVRIL
ncbi:MAG: hypothetical protein EOP47_10790 [Sphingobacteriaceae bacterium]|nr:MAG: hypothetical protein EOP47_10790 [Sphingobacteriaceae bacterium]